MTTTFTLPIHHLLICQPYLTTRTPIYRHLFFICQTFFKQFNKNPLCPTIIIRIRGVNLSLPINRESQSFHLPFKSRCIFRRYFLRFPLVFNRIIFRWQSKSIPTHGKHHLITLHSFKTSINITTGKRKGVTYV